MAVAGTLAVNVIAQTQQFQKGIQKARMGLKGFVGEVGKSRKMMLGWGSTLLGIGGAASLAAFARQQIDTAVALGETAEKLGIATDQLELFQFAGEQAGVSVQTIELGLQRMIKRIGQAARGTGEAAKTFMRLGINAKELVELDPAEQFERISSAINDLPNRPQQIDAYASIFDSEAVNLIKIGSQGINSFVDAFERAGGATATAGVRNAREFAQAANEFKRAIGATGRDFVLGITPAALDAVRGLQVIMDNISGRRDPRTAFEKTVQAKRGIQPGSDFDLEKIRQRAVTGLGEGMAALFASDPRGASVGARDQSLASAASTGTVDTFWQIMMLGEAKTQTKIMKATELATKPF